MSLSEDEISRYLAFAESLADAAAAVTLDYFRLPMDVDHKPGKGDFDPVTRADREAETAIRDLIREIYPDHGILGEEHGLEERGNDWAERAYWVIDPIDGTRAFISGLPLWGTLIAFNDGTAPLLGVADFPATGERFLGAPGSARAQARKLTDKPLETRACPALADATLSTTDPGLLAPGAEREAFSELVAQTRLTRYGYDCYAYCMLAAGFMDLVVESGLAPYDVQALIPLVEAAGGCMTDWQGGPADQGGRIIVAGDPRIHEQALAILSAVPEDPLP